MTRIGRNVLAMDDYLLSIQYFNQAIKAKPYLSDPYFYRAVAKLMLDDFKGAEEDCSLSLERNKFRHEAYKVRGYARIRLGNDSDAIEDLNTGLEYLPNDKYLLYYKAIAQSDKEDFEQADSTFRVLRKYYPKFEDGLEAYSRMLLMKGDTIAAYECATEALALTPNLTYPYLVKADIEQNRGEWEEATKSLSEAIRLQPREVSLYINRAFMRYNADDFFGAMADYNYAIDLDPENRPAVYNRALLRMQVMDLTNAIKDLTAVLTWDPDNFPARYNRVMINIEFEDYQQALSDIRHILNKYPKFYQGYYTLAEIYRRLGNERLYWENFHKANDMATRYVKDYNHFSIDRPSIEPGSSLSVRKDEMTSSLTPADTETDLTSQLNRLITISTEKDITDEPTPGKKNRISGKIQDIDVKAESQPLYAFTFFDTKSELRPSSNFFRELDMINSSGDVAQEIYLSNDEGSQNDAENIDRLFQLSNILDEKEINGKMQPSDYLTRGVVRTLIKNYDGALSDLNEAVELNPHFAAPYFQRSFTTLISAETSANSEVPFEDKVSSQVNADKLLQETHRNASFRNALKDLDAALEIDPRLSYAWYNKGCIYYAMHNYTDALMCFNEAININPDFGNAWFNRALTYMNLGNRQEAAAGLSKAGELGVMEAYNLLKRL